MTDSGNKLLPRFRYDSIRPRGHEYLQRGPGYQFHQMVPLDVVEVSTSLGLENYTAEAVEKAIRNYWPCAERLAKERARVIVFGGAPVSAVLTRPRVVELLRQTTEKTAIPADAPLIAHRRIKVSRAHQGQCRRQMIPTIKWIECSRLNYTCRIGFVTK
jgi:hypothetical protein